MSRLSLRDVPQEILLEILILVDAKTLIKSCSLVCRLWKDTIDSSTELRLSVELWADSMVPGDAGGSTLVDRLDALYKRRRAWLSLDWASRDVFPIEASSRAYELVDGIFAQLGGFDSDSFSTICLPSTRDLTTKTTLIGDLTMEARDFKTSLMWNAVLPTFHPHPLAAIHVLSFPVPNFAVGYLLVDLADDVISLFFDQHIVIVNWWEGRVVVDIDCSSWMFSPFSFCLLTPRSYILGCGGHACKIEIWSFETSGRSEPPIHMATLWLPAHIDTHYLSPQVHSGPFRVNPAARRPFSKSNEGRLCVISVDYGNLIVHHRYLRRYLLNPGGEAVTIPWDAWGPRHSRMLPSMPYRWFRYVHGERVVLPPDPENPRLLQVLDFGRSASRPGGYLGPTSESPALHCTVELHTEPSTLHDDLLGSESVTTSLPYRKITRYVDEEYGLFLIDEEQIIAVNDLESQMTVYTF
ncbi:hypothetical protein B0H13DRAFT_2347589 [Mycena leptocephala]|nr:hypothetical protein B0H13DRAFT_2347589 [Mycena leptocephala]